MVKSDTMVSMSSLPDMQNTPDERNIAIDKVGVRNVMYPIAVLDCANGKQHSIGNFQLTVDLPKEFKGTHMSRFVEILNQYSKEISVQALPEMLKALKERLKADFAHLEVTFPFFIEKKAPVSGMSGMMQYTCGFKATQNCTFDMVTTVEIPVTTLCPCSKEISDRGAHNQRGYVKVAIRTNKLVWIEEIISMVEACGSAPLYPLLKRPDEKFVTELAYDNPRFVEDMVREVALAFEADDRITSYEIEVENHESIHAHNAYAFVARDKAGQ